MTEQEFRDGLKKSVDHAGLSAERQQQVLARMKERKKMIKGSGKMKIVLALALVLVFSMGMVVAREIMEYVNWQGEAVDVSLYRPDEQQRRMLELMRMAGGEAGELTQVVVVNLNAEENGDVSASYSGPIMEHIYELEEMEQSVKHEAILPWPGNIPENYVLHNCIAEYACAGNGNYQVTEQAPTEDGLQVYCITIPEECRMLERYSLSVARDDNSVIEICVGAYTESHVNKVRIDEHSEVTALKVDGMDDALFITSDDETRLVMRKSYDTPIYVKEISIFGVNQALFGVSLDTCMIEIIARTPDVTADELLALFGLNAK